MYLRATVLKVAASLQHRFISILLCEDGTEYRYCVRIAITNYFIRPGDTIEYANNRLLWTTLEAEVAFAKGRKNESGRAALYEVELGIVKKPWRTNRVD